MSPQYSYPYYTAMPQQQSFGGTGTAGGMGTVQQQSWPSQDFWNSLNQLRQHFDQAVKSGKVLVDDAVKTIKLLEDAGNGRVPQDQLRSYADLINGAASGQVTITPQSVQQMWSWGGVWDGIKSAGKWAWDNKDTIIEVGKTVAKLFEQPQQQSFGGTGMPQQQSFGEMSKWMSPGMFPTGGIIPRGWPGGTGLPKFPPDSIWNILNQVKQDLDQEVKAGNILPSDAANTVKVLEDAANGRIPQDQLRNYHDTLNGMLSGQVTISPQSVQQMWSWGGLWDGIKSAGKWVWDNKGTIAKVAGTVAMLLEEPVGQRVGTQPYQQGTQPYQQGTQPYQQGTQPYQQGTQPYQQVPMMP